jgi:hypothetical protein
LGRIEFPAAILNAGDQRSCIALQLDRNPQAVVDHFGSAGEALLSQPFREVTFCASYKSHWFGELW